MRKSTMLVLLTLCLGIAFTGCSKETETVTETVTQVEKVNQYTVDPNSLYSRLGGSESIAAVVDQFIANVVADNRINGDFAATVSNEYRTKAFRNNLVDQVCAGSGGPCYYKGKSMAEAHVGQNVTEADFNALVEDLVAALDQFNVPAKEKNDLLAILAPMKNDIVGK